MASASVSSKLLLHSTLSSFPSNPNSKTSSLAPSSFSMGPWRIAGRLKPPSTNGNLVVALATRASSPKVSATAIEDDPAAEKFSRANSIADFMRFKRGEVGGSGGELQTAVVSYRKKFPQWLLQPFLQVDLVSTIHIADKEYFETLERELELYDCILYEMVASRESLENRINSRSTRKLKKSSKGFNIIGFIQRQMARLLSLDFQLDCLDYQGEKWQHADLDYETFKLLQHERGESFFTLAKEMTLRSTKIVMQPTNIPGDVDSWRSKLLWASRVLPMPLVGLLVITTICSPFEGSSSEYSEIDALSRLDVAAALKIFLAKRLTSEREEGGVGGWLGIRMTLGAFYSSTTPLERLIKTHESDSIVHTTAGKVGSGPAIHKQKFTDITAAIEEESVIIGERNRVAAKTVRKAIDNGHKRIAVLYGGGHMPDLGRRLGGEFDMVPFQVQWITAWSIKSKELNSKSLPFLKKLAKLLGWPLNRYQTLALLLLSSVLALDLWFWELFVGTALKWASSAAYEVSLFH